MRDNQQERRHHHAGWKITAVAALIALGVVTYNAAVDTTSEDQARKLAAAQIASCEAGNVVRAVGVIDAGRNAREPVTRQAAILRVYQFRDCPQTQEQGRPVELTASARHRFIDNVARLMGITGWDRQPRADRARP